jgi:hypothetical protein
VTLTLVPHPLVEQLRALGLSEQRARDLAEEACECIATCELSESEAADYLSSLFAEVRQEAPR